MAKANAQTKAPAGTTLGVNLPPTSVARKLRQVSRLIRVRLAQDKAKGNGDHARAEALEASRQQIRLALIAVDVEVPASMDALYALRADLEQRANKGEQ